MGTRVDGDPTDHVTFAQNRQKPQKSVLDNKLLRRSRRCAYNEDNSRFTRSASPRFLGGVSSRGRVSINFAKALHSTGEKKSYRKTSLIKGHSIQDATYVDNNYLVFKDRPAFQIRFRSNFRKDNLIGWSTTSSSSRSVYLLRYVLFSHGGSG